MDLCRIYSEICRTALAAGEIISQTEAASVAVTQKSGTANYVTECDIKVQAFIFERLSAFAPEIGFFGEEDAAEKSHSRYTFIVDPIDGTSNYMFGLKLSTVSIALCDLAENQTLAGAIYCPYTGDLFSAIKGGGAFLNGDPMQVSDNGLEHSLAAFGSTPYNRANAKMHMNILADVFAASADVRNLGSAALHLAYLAAGKFAGFYETTLSPWDYAAGALLITEAGGKISNFDGDPPSLDRPDSIVAGNAAAYPRMLEIIRRHM